MLRHAGIVCILITLLASDAVGAADVRSCAGIVDVGARADCWVGLGDSTSRRLQVVDAGVAADPATALETLERLTGDLADAHVGDRAWHAELRARALQGLDRSDDAAAAWEEALAIHDGTDRLDWVEPEAWSAALDVGDGRLVRAAQGLAAAGRNERAREIAAQALALGDRDAAQAVWEAAGGEEPPMAPATAFVAPPWRDMLPALDLPMFGGKTFSLAEARGKVIVVDFWASWCAPCVKELPFLDELYREFRDQGLEVVAVNYQEPPDAAMAFAQTLGLSLPIAIATSEANRFFKIESMPTVVIADREGGVRARWGGYEEDVRDQMREVVTGLLDEERAEAPPIGEIYAGEGLLEVEWIRGAREPILGVGFVEVADDERRIAAVLNRSIDLFLATGHVDERVAVPPGVGRVFSTRPPDAAPLVVSYRPGGRQVLSFENGGTEMLWFDAPAPVFAVAARPGDGETPFALATLEGVFAASRDGKTLRALEKLGPASDIVWTATEGRVLETTGRLLRIDRDGKRRGKGQLLDGAWNLVWPAEADLGYGVTGFGVTSTALGRFLGGDGWQAALALSSDQLVLVDLDRGEVVFRARIDGGISGLAAGDVDANGRQALFLSSGKRLVRLACGDCDRRIAEVAD